MIELKDVIHFYLGAPCSHSLSVPEGTKNFYETTVSTWVLDKFLYHPGMLIDFKLFLRPWEDLKIEEVRDVLTWPTDCVFKKNRKGQILYIGSKPLTLRANEYAFLCSIHIDLFGLIKSGQVSEKK